MGKYTYEVDVEISSTVHLTVEASSLQDAADKIYDMVGNGKIRTMAGNGEGDTDYYCLCTESDDPTVNPDIYPVDLCDNNLDKAVVWFEKED